MTQQATTLLKTWLARQLHSDAMKWLDGQLETAGNDEEGRSFAIAFGMIPRKLGKADLELTEKDLADAEACRSGWNPSPWSVDVAARILLLLESDSAQTPVSVRFADIRRTADVSESLALHYGLPLYPDPQELAEHAILGLRTNMRSEFESIAHNNPFPAEHFGQNPWNNMVLKALFIGSMLDPIQGFDERANADLARILQDYAHERRAAGRAISPELWRGIGPFATEDYLEDFEQVIDSGNTTEKKAIALALKAAPDSARKNQLSDRLSQFDADIENGSLTWRSIADEMLDNALATTKKLNFEVELTR